MLKNYLKIAFRNLIGHKTFSLINILGFAFGISVCMMIVLYLMKENSFDKFNVNADSIYRLVDAEDNYSSIDYRVKKTVMDNFPQVENACIVEINSMSVETNYKDNAYYVDNIMSTDNDFFKMFTVNFIYGNPNKPFQNINSVVLSETASHLLFGKESPLGKEITLFHSKQLIVTGVIKDFSDNSSLRANIIVNSENSSFRFEFSCGDYSDVSSHRWLFNIYLQLNKNTDPQKLIAEINKRAELLAPYVKKVNLPPLKKMYLYDYTKGGEALKGNPSLLDLMASIALIVLLLAMINYVNLTVARQNKRNKETGIRKTVGASRKDMIFLFLAESIMVTTIAFGIALIFLSLGLPFFNGIVDCSLSIRTFTTFPINLIIISSIFLIGILSGIGPALILSSFNPVRILNGGIFSSSKKSFFRNALTVFQFTVSIGLIFCIIVIQKQINFVKNQNPGFDKEQLLDVSLPSIQQNDKTKALLMLNKLKQYEGIKNLSLTCGVPGSINMQMGSGVNGKDKYLKIIYADSTFLQTFEIKQIKGRNLLPGDMGNVCMLNETAYKYFGWTDLRDKRFNNGKVGGFEVIGVVKDFNYSSMHDAIEPACIIFSAQLPTDLTIRITGKHISNTITNITNTWKEILPDYPLKYRFYDEWFDTMYRKEDRLAQTIGLFALLAISISCLGILGLAIFSSESRSKEIGIRKVHGAGIKDLMLMLNIDYIKWVVVALIIACPTARYIMQGWLQEFAYRTEISWWVFALSAITALSIALLTVSWQTWRAANANPVESLRYE